MEKVVLHFDFSHLQRENAALELKFVNQNTEAVIRSHTPETRLLFKSQNTLLGALSQPELDSFTHYVEEAMFSTEEVSFNIITYPSTRPDAVAGEIAAMFNYIPRKSVRKAVKLMHSDNQLAVPARLRLRTGNRLLAGLDVSAPDALDKLTLHHEHSSLTVTVLDTALSIVMQHPEIASVMADVQYRIAEEIIMEDPYFDDFWPYIADHSASSPEPWYQNTYVKDPNGVAMEPMSGLKDAQGNTLVWPTKEIGGKQVSVIPQYNLTAGVEKVLLPLVQSVLKRVKDTPWLKGSNWSALNGSTCESSVSDQSDPVLKAKHLSGQAAAIDWTIVNKTSEYGLDLFKDSLQFDAKTNKISFNVKNWPNRGLGVYCRFQKAGAAENEFITDLPDWTNDIKGIKNEVLREWFEKKGSAKKYLRYIGAGNVFFGAPVWTPNVNLSFPVPKEASTVQVLFGGLGVGNWDMEVDKIGLIYTCVASYGVPALLSALSVGVSSASWYKKFFEDPEKVIALVAAAIPCFGVVLGAGTAMGVDVETILIKAAGFVAGIVFSKLMEALALKVTGYVTKELLLQNAPVVGIALKVAGMASAIASMIATTAEVLQSPATYTIEAKRFMNMKVTVKPDVTHGTSTQAPIWPKTGKKYQILVQYEGGTFKKKMGRLPAVSDEPIEVLFSQATGDELPVAPNVKIQVIATIYSENDTLVGRWISGWMPAAPEPKTGMLLSVAGSITEMLIPLLPGTRYTHGEKLNYNGAKKKYEWLKTTEAPRATRTVLPNQAVSELVNITINNQAYKLGYCYRANSQNLPVDYGGDKRSTPMYLFKAISTLANPGAGMKVSDRGFSIHPYISFDQFGPAGLFTLEKADDYMPDLNKKKEVSIDLKAAFTKNRLTLPQGAEVKCITEGGAWSIGEPGKDPIYDLRRQVDVIKVFVWPVPEFSPNNFYLDTRTYESQQAYHLRLVNLNDNSGSNFDFASTKSYGRFPMSRIDAVVIHPNGYAIAISYKDNKLAIVEIPKVGKDDKDAPLAIPFAGKGLREGLLQGPVAITVTADGRILVLEDLNARIQAFDTKGNCVPCFKAELVFSVPGAIKQDLTNKSTSIALLQAMQKGVPVKYADKKQRYLLMPVVSVPSTFKTDLNNGQISEQLRKAFAKGTISLGNNTTCHCTDRDKLWIIEDKDTQVSFDLRFNGEGMAEIDVYRSMNFSFSEKSPGKLWNVADQTNALHFDVRLVEASGMLEFARLSPVMKLKDPAGSKLTYVDIACENKGFIYVLSYKGDGGSPADYKLDIYNPDGTVLTPDKYSNNGQINAAHFTVDQWRNVFTLNYEQMAGTDGRMEPTISQWFPSTPGPGEIA
jgi:hypothetical protein